MQTQLRLRPDAMFAIAPLTSMLADYAGHPGILLAGIAGLGNFARRDQWLLVTLGFLLLTGFLLRVAPSERTRVRGSGMLYGFALVLLLLGLAADLARLSVLARSLHEAAVLLVGFSLVNLLTLLLFGVAVRAVHLHAPRIARDLVVALGYLTVIYWRLRVADVTPSSLITTSALLTAVIAFSLQDTLGNIMGGMALQLERSISVGDWVRIDQTEGCVTEIRWRHTAIETRNWDTLIIPNSALMKGQVLVLGRRTGEAVQHRMWVYFNVDFRIAPSDVISVVEDALRAQPIPCVAQDPPPNCIAFDFKESYVHYAVRYWLTDILRDDPTNSAVRLRVYFALKRAGIPLSIPAHALFVSQETRERKDEHLNRELVQRLAALRGVELFHTMTEEELRTLAAHLRYAPFTSGEAMTRQSGTAHWLYIITKGAGEVLITSDGVQRRVATLGAGDFFGEIGMMLGIPRTATVRAVEDTDCYRLDKEGFQQVLQNRPAIAEHISQVMARRRVELDSIRDNLDAETRLRHMQHAQQDIIKRISHFFGLSSAAGAGK